LKKAHHILFNTIISCICLLATQQIYAQSNLPPQEVDSLFAVWNDETQPDTSRLKAIERIAWYGYVHSKPDSAFYYAQQQYDFAKKKHVKKKMISALSTQGVSWYFRGDYEKSIELYKKGLTIAQEIGYKQGEASLLNKLGLAYQVLGDLQKAIDYFVKRLSIDEELGNIKSMIIPLNNIGGIYTTQGNYEKAIGYYAKSLKLSEEIGDKRGMAITFSNYGKIYLDQGYLDKAMNYYVEGLKIREETNDLVGIGNSYIDIGIVYKNQGDSLLEKGNTKRSTDKFLKALDAFTKSLKIKEESGDKFGTASCLINIGVIHDSQGNYEKAITYNTKSLIIAEEIGSKHTLAVSSNNLGKTYLNQGKYNKALIFCERSLEIAKEVGLASQISVAALSLWEINKKMGRFNESLEMYELYITTRDSLESEANQKEVIRQEFKYKYEKQAAADSVVNAEAKKVTDAKLVAEQAEKKRLKSESKRQQLENKNQQQQAYFLYGGLALALLFGTFIFNRFRVTKKQKGIIEAQKSEVEQQKEKVDEAYEQLEEKNTEILDSINYAKRIQSAILPPDKLVKEYLKNSFILYKPKDIVAGDFYWMEPTKNGILFAAADCTGHGVPGAMVSVVCNNALNRSVREYGLSDPGKILDKTREIVIQEFEKSEDEVKDGMDIALCSLTGNTLQYAGAHNPLWIVRNGEVLETKANKQPIGKFDHPLPYITHAFELQKNDGFYIFSDGFVDQFGGQKGKKFKAKAFRELLLSIQEKSMEEQRTQINQAFEKWRGDLEQVDDVCVIGVKV
jgi:serine phosphatase RsbU (regulator of sigma subunit)